MTSLDTLLISAIVGTVAGIAALWRYAVQLNQQARDAEKESSRLIFALLQRLALARGERPPSTISTSTNIDNVEAKAMALKELNGEIEHLLKEFLDSEPPTKPGKKQWP
jgi:hypothetical protein